MTTPTYSHTYTYVRTGVGDVIALDAAGAPYSLSVVEPAGWETRYWWHPDPLASVFATAGWTQFSPTGVPSTAAQIAVDVRAVPADLAANDPRLKVTVGSANYKAATGHRYTDSGAHSSVFTGVANDNLMPFPGAEYWFQTDELSTMWKDVAGTDPVVTIDVDRALRIDNMGSAGGFLSKSSGGPKYVSTIGTATGVTGALQFEPNGQEHLGAVIADGAFASGDWGFFWVADRVNQAGGAEFLLGFDSVNLKMGAKQVASNRMEMDVAGEAFSPTETVSDSVVQAGYGTTDGVSVRTAGFNVRATEFSTGTGVFTGPGAGTILDLGGDDNDNNNTFHGRIFEIVIAKNTHANRALWEAYSTTRYSVIWA